MKHKLARMLEAGEKAPSFELQSHAGGSLALPDLLGKSPVILAFFKISCPVCQLTAPFLERLAANPSIPVIGISQDDASGTLAFVKRFGLRFPVLLDTCRTGYVVSNGFGISSVPSIFLVEQDSSISFSFSGFCRRDLAFLGQRVGIHPFRPDEKLPEFKAG